MHATQRISELFEDENLDMAPGISTAFIRNRPFDPLSDLPMIADAGFRCIELSCFRGGLEFPWDSASAMRDLKRVLKDTGLRVVSVHGSGGIGGSRSTQSEKLPLDIYKAQADFAAEIGSPIVVIHAFPDVKSDPQTAKLKLMGSLEALARHVRAMPCMFAWENEIDNLPPAQHISWLRELPESTFCFLFDNGHSHVAGNTEEYLELCHGLVGGLHLHDNHGKKDDHLIPGRGSFPWKHFIEKLELTGYRGPFVMEFADIARQDKIVDVLADGVKAFSEIFLPNFRTSKEKRMQTSA